MEKVACIKVSGVFDLLDNKVSLDDFSDALIEWVESKGWQYGGMNEVYEGEEKSDRQLLKESRRMLAEVTGNIQELEFRLRRRERENT